MQTIDELLMEEDDLKFFWRLVAAWLLLILILLGISLVLLLVVVIQILGLLKQSLVLCFEGSQLLYSFVTYSF